MTSKSTLLRSDRRVRLGAAAIAGYHVALFLVIISYYALAVIIGFYLGLLAYFAARGAGTANSANARAIAILLVGCFLALLIRMIPTLWVELKGLLTREHDENDPDATYGVVLAQERYPELYDEVRKVAKQVHAPMPHEIRITPRAECHVAECRRFSILPDRRLVLVLGMPHLCVFSRGELQVILAHELSHLRAGDTRLGVFVFRFIESLQMGIDLMENRRWPLLNVLYPLSKLYLAFVRPLTAPLVRRQELLADAVSARTYGGALAAATLLKEWQLGMEFDAAVARHGAEASSDDWPGLFARFRSNWREFSDEGREYLRHRLGQEERRGFWESHPTTAERIETMSDYAPTNESAPGLARELFPDFPALEREMSRLFARELITDLAIAMAGEPAPAAIAAFQEPAPACDGDLHANEDTAENALEDTVSMPPRKGSKPPRTTVSHDRLPESTGPDGKCPASKQGKRRSQA